MGSGLSTEEYIDFPGSSDDKKKKTHREDNRDTADEDNADHPPPKTYAVTMKEACTADAHCCIADCICPCPTRTYMRYRALNLVEPGSGWKNYECGQGRYSDLSEDDCSGCEKSCPCPCMCVESCCCAQSSAVTSMIVRQHYQLGLSEEDKKALREGCLAMELCCLCAVCGLICGGCCDCSGGGCCNDGSSKDKTDSNLCDMASCITAQTHHEIIMRERLQARTTMTSSVTANRMSDR